jgi:hypothetical protein
MVPPPGVGACALERFLRILVFNKGPDRDIELERGKRETLQLNRIGPERQPHLLQPKNGHCLELTKNQPFTHVLQTALPKQLKWIGPQEQLATVIYPALVSVSAVYRNVGIFSGNLLEVFPPRGLVACQLSALPRLGAAIPIACLAENTLANSPGDWFPSMQPGIDLARSLRIVMGPKLPS